MVTVQPSLGHAHRGNVHQQPEMAGDPEAARMRDALPVAQQQIRRLRASVPAPPAPPATRETTAGPAYRETWSGWRATTVSSTASSG
jgi:hypothetical protein